MTNQAGSEGSPGSCCSPGREQGVGRKSVVPAGSSPEPVPSAVKNSAVKNSASADEGDRAGYATIPAGTFTMGTGRGPTYPADGEAHPHTITIDEFRIDATAVSNARFDRFVQATGYVTDAERYGWSFVFAGLLPAKFEETRGVAAAPWWRQVYGATWRSPEGAGSTIDGRSDHPVVHVSHNDAVQYCRWSGCRLPTEAEWEYAARGGLAEATFPWGDELTPDGAHNMNVWQGEFPVNNLTEDGYYGTAPVDSFKPNAYGLFNSCGNVWEWCADWFDPDYYRHSPDRAPTGPTDGQQRVMRGGSYLCHASYCHRYRVGARSANSPESGSGNQGFRTAKDN